MTEDRHGEHEEPVQQPVAPADRGGRVVEVSMNEQSQVAAAFLEGLLSLMRLEATVSSTEVDEETVELAIKGADLGLLIGPRGTTLGALQDLTRIVVQQRTGATNGRMLVDVSGYRQKRREALERFTRDVAAEVRTTGTRRTLEPMSAADRKIVHDTVNEIEGVATASEGEEPARYVVIMPEVP
jgi:spoIIIJ-associated protein